MVRITSSTLLSIGILLALFSEGRGQDSTRTTDDSLAVGKKAPANEANSNRINKEKQLKQFRQAFDKVLNAKKEKRKIKQKQKVQKDPTLNLGVLVLDETRTKMGRDFYSLFYQNWEDPDNASNLTITISEQPSPGIGSLVSIKIDYNLVFRARLQPRYDYITEVSKQAVARCRRIVAQKEKVRKQLSGF